MVISINSSNIVQQPCQTNCVNSSLTNLVNMAQTKVKLLFAVSGIVCKLRYESAKFNHSSSSTPIQCLSYLSKIVGWGRSLRGCLFLRGFRHPNCMSIHAIFRVIKNPRNMNLQPNGDFYAYYTIRLQQLQENAEKQAKQIDRIIKGLRPTCTIISLSNKRG